MGSPLLPAPLSEGSSLVFEGEGWKRDKFMPRIFNDHSKQAQRKNLRNQATPQEIILWSRLRRSALGCKFRRQASIGVYVVDFYCPEEKLAIELDGWQHDENKAYDEARTSFLESFGIRVLRFLNNEVNDNLRGVILRIEEFIKK